ncbi:hypothetical protein [Sinisalibacter aestuarii]|uniref:Uncharacterized protein n=1 Tax=Sinisalibacter aestuarii TaxID=2949426 RepID=A0ABQ5LW37_9RHOB|nr:hypothetical protein [Sinisalibacter aestuarii]GKY88585.1 hypothetical protein STA1M1_24540 [Sinisalibacter aestuarii]
MRETSDQDFPEGWGGLTPEQAALFTAQLRAELGRDHPFRRFFATGAIRAIGAADGSDDVVFAIAGWDAPYFASHLTWAAADTRPALLRRLRPRPRPVPGITPLHSLAALHGAVF